MKKKQINKTVDLNLTVEELKKLQSILRWHKLAIRPGDNERKIVETILHKIRKLNSNI